MAMINRKDTPAPPMQRPNPPPSLHLKGAPTKPLSHKQPPPLTPPYRARMKSGRASKLQSSRPTPRETYRDGLTEGKQSNARGAAGDEAAAAAPKERISHDLSLTENPRHSVVDNMLMSLNPDQPRYVPPSVSQRPSHLAGPQSASLRSFQHRGHLKSSSSASDSTISVEESPSRFSTQFGRGRRSNSSSNFQTPLARIDSGRQREEAESKKRVDGVSRQSTGTTDRPSVPGSRAGRKGSKSSGSSSVDFGSMTGATKWQGSLGRRSSSFDHGHRRQTSSLGSSPPVSMSTNRPQLIPPFGPDTAVPPIVPSGPRSRDQSPSKQHKITVTERPGSNGSTKVHKLKKHRGDGIEGMRPRLGRSKSPEKRQGVEQLNQPHIAINPKSASKVIVSRAQSPTRPFHESTSANRQGSVSQLSNSPRERPGFFRRVFGSSRNSNTLYHEVHPQSSRNSVRADSQTGFNVPNTFNRADPSSEMAHPVITKKSSSFFRRRKKSVSEPVIAPVMSTSIPSQLRSSDKRNDIIPEPSPASSLRQVMDPFLHHPPTRRRNSSKGQEMGLSATTPPSRPAMRPSYSRQLSLQELHQPRSAQPGSTSVPRNPSSASATVNVKPDNHSFHPPPSSLHDNRPTNDNNDTSKSTDRDAVTPWQADENRGQVTPWELDTDPMAFKRTVKTFPVDTAYHKENDPRLTSPKTFPLEKPPKPTKPTPALALRDLNTTSTQLPKAAPKKAGRRDWLTAAHISPAEEKPLPPEPSSSEERMFLQPRPSDEDHPRSAAAVNRTELAEVSPVSAYETALSSPNQPKPEISPVDVDQIRGAVSTNPEVIVDECEPTSLDRELAAKVFHGDESLVAKAKAAAWLGDEGSHRARIRRAYMDMFEWQDINILAALRDFCSKILLKGETQQMDRLLDALSSRWCNCNPNHGFKATDVVHTICYSILLLNTDLHVADIECKMTRAQFLKNAMPTIRRVVADAAPNAFESKRASTLPPTKAWPESPVERPKSPTLGRSSTEIKRSFEGQRPSYRLSQRPSDQSGYFYSNGTLTPLDYENPTDDCGPLVKAPFRGKLSTWEVQVEIVLKNFYNCIRQERLPLFGTETLEKPSHSEQTPLTSSLSAMTGNMLRRTPSMLSKAGSEQLSYRGRVSEQRFGTGRWTSKSRQRPRLYPTSTVGSSRNSLEDPQSSVWTPSASSTWSKYSFGRTQTSMSVESFASSFPEGEYQRSIGFANALSQAIIREETAGIEQVEEIMRAAPLLEDESLELAGAPWAKEGILKHKRHLDSIDKKAKDRNWVESFAVIEKGCMRLFSFSMNAKSMRQKMKSQKMSGGVVGGGNWMDSAEALGNFSLRHTIASALPPPGYSKTRPHVWALSLPTGAVHLFHVGTPEIVKEFVTTANYWSARLSKEPLVGGVSNIEYGWGDSVINAALIHTDNPPSTSGGNGPRPSLQSSIRSSIDQSSSRPKLPGDKVIVNDWKPPQQSMVASVLMEVDQLRALTVYVKNIEEELQKHNELRPAMLLAFSPRHTNSAKAMANWERKSSYLLREIVKFTTYFDCLQAAQAQKEKIYSDRQPPVEQDASNVVDEAGVKQAAMSAGAVEPTA